jgi:hypothetical protein
VGYIAPTGADGSDRIGDFVQVPLAQEFCGVPALECAVEQLPRFIELGRTQDAQESLVSGAPAGSTTALGDELVRRGLYTVVHRGDDAVLLERTAQGG